MSLPPRVQTLVDQIVQELGLQALRPIGLDIDIDPSNRIVTRIEPRLRFSREKGVDNSAGQAQA